MYILGNPPTKKILVQLVRSGKAYAYNPGCGTFGKAQAGEDVAEGPHAPKPHTWYARIKIADGGKVLSVHDGKKWIDSPKEEKAEVVDDDGFIVE